jgi:hypothetical protein
LAIVAVVLTPTICCPGNRERERGRENREREEREEKREREGTEVSQ